MKISYLGHTLKQLDPSKHGRRGWRHSRTGREFATRADAEGFIALQFYPFVGGPPVTTGSVNHPGRRA